MPTIPAINNYKDLMTFNKALSQTIKATLNIEGVLYVKNLIKVNGEEVNIDRFLYDYVVNKSAILTGKVSRLRDYDFTRLNYLLHPETKGEFVNRLISFINNSIMLGNTEGVELWDFTITLEGNDIVLKRCNKIKAQEIFIPSFISKIGDWAIAKEYPEDSDFANLEKVTIESNSKLRVIGKYAFSNCDRLKEINLPSGLEEIGADAFHYNQLLKSLIFEENSKLRRIGSDAFQHCYALSTISLPSSLEEIGDEAFLWCSKLVTVSLPSSLKKVGSQAFMNCASLKNITIPDNVRELGDEAFMNCISLESIVIGRRVDKIASRLVLNCTNLKEVIVLGKIKEIEEYAFYKCLNLECIYLPVESTFKSSPNDVALYGAKIKIKQ